MDKEYKDKKGKTLWGLLRGKHTAPARWAVDNLDPTFLDSLSDDDRIWFSHFMAEYYSNIFPLKKLKVDAQGKKMLRKDGKSIWDYSDCIHPNPTRAGIFDAYNARRSDAISFKDLKGLVKYPDSQPVRNDVEVDASCAYLTPEDEENVEDAWVAGIDAKYSRSASRAEVLAGSKPRPVSTSFITRQGVQTKISAMSYADGSGYILKEFKCVDDHGVKYFLDDEDPARALKTLKALRRSQDVSSGARGRKSKHVETDW